MNKSHLADAITSQFNKLGLNEQERNEIINELIRLKKHTFDKPGDKKL